MDGAYDLAAKIFGPNYYEASAAFAQTRVLEPLQSLEDAVVAVRGQEVVGFVRILDRQMYSPAGMVKVEGITTVCIHPELRGSGWGLSIMEAALQRSRVRGDALSILFARWAADGWYAKLGYVGIGCHPEMRTEASSAAQAFDSFNGTFKTGIVTSYLDTYAKSYEDSYSGLFLSFHRSDDWWRNLEQRLAHRVDWGKLVNVIVGGNPIGYFMLSAGRVIEAGSLHAFREEFLSALVSFFAGRSGDGPVLALPCGHWCVNSLRRANHTMSVRFSWDGGHMVRIINKDVFREMAIQSVDFNRRRLVDHTFGRYDVSIHAEARHLMLAMCGAIPINEGSTSEPEYTGSDPALIPMLPTWSVVDGLW